jgi:uncharacterized protein (DUF362 family)
VIKRPVVIKVGVFSHKAENHVSVRLVDAIIECFDKAPKVFVAESDNYKGTGLERLEIWKELYSERVVPFNLSDDSITKRVEIANQQMDLPQILFKPNVLVDAHILRSFESGSILKNLFGCILDSKRMKYHKVLPALLADVYEAIGGVDLAVLDGTYLWRGAGDAPVRMNTVLVGRDAVAVETVGATLAGLDPHKMPVIQEFVKRGLGEGCLENIELVGTSFDQLLERSVSVSKAQKKKRTRSSGPQTWGGLVNRAFGDLIQVGFFKQPAKRTIPEVMKALEERGLLTKGKEDKIMSFLERRTKKGVLKKSEASGKWVYWIE